jgi:AraC family transcriptional regulator, positive regulator of tynA and feaB
LPETALTGADHGGDRPACLQLECDRPLVGLFRGYLDQLWKQAPEMNTQEAEAAREALVTLAVGLIRTEDGLAGDGSVLRVLNGRLTDWITNNIHKGSIHIADLAAAHNVSARTVHRAFATTGDTMTSVVRRRRLAAARDDIVHTQLTMTAIAHRCGFYDPSHLAREFRRQFGVSPASYRDAHGCS